MLPPITSFSTSYSRFSVAKNSNGDFGSFYFLVDEERFAYVEEHSDFDGAPGGYATINIELTAGQLVRIQNLHSDTIWGTAVGDGYFSWFTGHLLYAL